MLILPKQLIAEDALTMNLLPAAYTKDELVTKVYKYANKYGVSPTKMEKLIDCEDPDWNPDLQSRIVKKGKREESYGLSQINLPSHPTITKQQAIDPDFSLDFMARNLKDGKANIWSCNKKLS